MHAGWEIEKKNGIKIGLKNVGIDRKIVRHCLKYLKKIKNVKNYQKKKGV